MSNLKKQILFCTIGSILEWYEFTIFVALSPIISQLFFPNSNHFSAMMSTFAVFASGFVMRPIGALYFGHVGDTLGRKYTLLMTIFIMAIATTSIGLIPVGTSFSTLLLVICRLIQGFACSGEYPGALALLSEQNHVRYQSLISSTGIFATIFGGLVGVVIYIVISKLVGHENMLHWGWRVLFLLAGPLGIIGYLFRQFTTESKEFEKLKQHQQLSRAPIIELLSKHYHTVMAVLCISILTNTLIYINFLYIGSYSIATHKLTTDEVTTIYLLTHVVTGIAILLFGFLSDLLNKRRLMMIGALLIGFLSYPLYEFILSDSVFLQYAAQLLLALLVGVVVGPFSSVLPESFPTAVRCTGVAFTLNIAGSFFGGTAPMICGWLTSFTQTAIAPSFYLAFLAATASIATIYLLFLHKPATQAHLTESLS